MSDHVPRCPNGPRTHATIRSDVHDAYYCVVCDAWVEAKCADLECGTCRGRPEKPSQQTGKGQDQ